MAEQQDEAEDVYVEHQFMCSECHQLFNTLEDVLVHQQIHTAPEGEEGVEAVNSLAAQGIPEVGQDQQYQCLECGTLLINSDELLQHQEMHMREVGTEMEQDMCEVIETQVEVKQEPQDSQPVQYQCLDCLALFNSAETWLEHRHTHSRSVTHSNPDQTVEYILQPDGTITPLHNMQNHVLSEEQAGEILAQVLAQQQQQKKFQTLTKPMQPGRSSLLPSVTPTPGSATMHLQILTAQALADRSSSPAQRRTKLSPAVAGSKKGPIENGVQRVELRLASNIQNVAHHQQSTEMFLLSHPYECSECSLVFNTPEDFLQHQGEHFLAQDKESEETGVINIFDESRIEAADKATEIRLSIKEKKTCAIWSTPQQCDLCPRTFTTASRLACHRRVHEQGTFECAECGKIFKRAMSLETHMRSHTGVARFLCVDCGQGFATELTLITHRKMHTADPFYKCSFCNKMFTSMTKQLYHRRIHLNHHEVSAPVTSLMIAVPKRAPISALAILQKAREKKNSLWAPIEEDQTESSQMESIQEKEEEHDEEKPVINSSNVSTVNDSTERTSTTETKEAEQPSPEVNDGETLSTEAPALSTDNSTFSCRSCSKTFSSQKQLVHHRRKTHASECSFMCGICGKSFKKQIHVNNHIRTHTGERPYQCSDCGKTFSLLANLIRHNLIHSGIRPYRCEVCNRSFSQSSNLRNHSLLHSKAALLSCPDCPAKFRWPAKLALHRFKKHPGSPAPFPCSHCEAGFLTLKSRDAHCLQQHPALVGASTKSEQGPNAPMVTEETPQPSTSAAAETTPDELAVIRGSHDCSICGKKLNSLANLKLHKLSHFAVGPGRPRSTAGKRPKAHQCPVCGKRFVSSSGVALHQRVHTGERPFPCQVCGKRFRQNTHLREHLRTHSGERPFHCELCGKNFIQSMHLAEHRRTHTGERPHVCPLCGKAFKTFSNLRNHKKTHARQQQQEDQAATLAAMETETTVAVVDNAAVEVNIQPQLIQIQTADIQQTQGTPTIMCNEFGETIAIIETSEGGALPLEQALEIYQTALENGLGLEAPTVERVQLL